MIINKLKSNRFLRWIFRRKSIFTIDNIKIKNVTVSNFSYGTPIIGKGETKDKLKIGKFCSIASNVTIIVDGNHRPDWVSTYPFGEIFNDVPKNSGHPVGKGDMEIGNDVWIGQNVLILPGVKIGDGAVIAGGAVVVKNVGDYEIVGGNPAKHLKFRFNSEQIKSLKKISWWNWELDKIKKEVSDLQSQDVDSFIKKNLSF